MSKKNNLATRRRQHEFDLQSNMTATTPCPLSLSLHGFLAGERDELSGLRRTPDFILFRSCVM
jgi:hypothetical protein